MTKTVEIENNKSQKLIGALNECKSDTLVILCHGYTASKDMDGFIHLAKSLNEKEISTFRFDFSDKQLSLKQEVADLNAVIGHFKTYKQVYLLGHSLGVLPALACASDNSITGIISVNGFFQGKIYRKDFNQAYQTIRVLRFVVPRIANEWKYMTTHTNPNALLKPMLLITTKNDEILDYRQSLTFGEKLRQKHTLETVSLSGHGISTANDGKKIATSIHTWINQQ